MSVVSVDNEKQIAPYIIYTGVIFSQQKNQLLTQNKSVPFVLDLYIFA